MLNLISHPNLTSIASKKKSNGQPAIFFPHQIHFFFTILSLFLFHFFPHFQVFFATFQCRGPLIFYTICLLSLAGVGHGRGEGRLRSWGEKREKRDMRYFRGPLMLCTICLLLLAGGRHGRGEGGLWLLCGCAVCVGCCACCLLCLRPLLVEA